MLVGAFPASPLRRPRFVLALCPPFHHLVEPRLLKNFAWWWLRLAAVTALRHAAATAVGATDMEAAPATTMAYTPWASYVV